MSVEGWKYYNNAIIPTTPPHEEVSPLSIQKATNWKIWKNDGKRVFFARWTSDWDAQDETKWWYVIKDSPFDINELKAKRRYEVNKGIKNFDVTEIDCKNFKEEIYAVQMAARRVYSEHITNKKSKEKLFYDIENKWDYYKSYGAIYKETGEFCGYALLRKDGKYINYALQYAKPEFEKYGVNAALVNKILEDHKEFLLSGGYICDGSRTIHHESAFQDYLQKYFGFRKAYCRLHVKYKTGFGIFVSILYPFRNILKKSGNGKIKKVSSVLTMEEVVRNG